MQCIIVVGMIKIPYFFEVLQIIILCQKILLSFQVLQDPGVDLFTVVQVIFVMIQIADKFKIVAKGLQPDIGMFQKFFYGKLFRLKMPVGFFLIMQDVPVADTVGRKVEIEVSFRMLVGKKGDVLP